MHAFSKLFTDRNLFPLIGNQPQYYGCQRTVFSRQKNTPRFCVIMSTVAPKNVDVYLYIPLRFSCGKSATNKYSCRLRVDKTIEGKWTKSFVRDEEMNCFTFDSFFYIGMRKGCRDKQRFSARQ